MRFVIVTGMSGSGKSIVIKMLEDMGYYCADGMPASLVSKFAEICFAAQGTIEKAALVFDTRNRGNFSDLLNELNVLKEKGFNYEILFMDASDETIVKRYKETRRPHPLAEKGERISDTIKRERTSLDALRREATHKIDTTGLKSAQIKKIVSDMFGVEENKTNFSVNVMSFGFKYGIPLDADLVFDVRFLPNPFYIPELKEKTGIDKEVSDYVLSCEPSEEFKRKLISMIDFLLPHYFEEGKSQLVIAIGCTGGKHRSVTFAELLYKHIKKECEYPTFVTHRDCMKE